MLRDSANSRFSAFHHRNETGSAAIGLFVCAMLLSVGCRAISRIGESRQSLAARKLSRQGMQAMHHGQWNSAEKLFSDALAVSDDDDRAHRGLSETLWKRGERELAIEHMEQAVQRSAGDPRLVGRLGEMYLDVGRLEEASRQSQIALETERNTAEIWALRGDCLRESGDPEGAMAAYHRALALQPDYTAAKLQVAELYLANDQYDRLLATLDQIDPSGDDAVVPTRVHMLRGIAMRNLGRNELAAKHFAKAIQSDPTRAEPHLQVAAIELENNRPAAASEAIARAIELDRALVESSGWSAYLLPGGTRLATEPEPQNATRR
ncbi:tetratricopeptide repeat protein [Roseiconus nitratireducens]|uniref:Tetratricopeptide repeat protein n=1 Tax=Roseiconus nitratireducens TaxID=2605748 RepID=A0A5M6DD41_9BACT|nr:tetratricopeptide repeat protein [Roseiconus nitratireducens]KAA5544386.1 tetratricopeptide repeat protein [Roseiconus nitratireducens]